MQHLTEIDTEVIYQIYLLSKSLLDKRHPEKRSRYVRAGNETEAFIPEYCRYWWTLKWPFSNWLLYLRFSDRIYSKYRNQWINFTTFAVIFQLYSLWICRLTRFLVIIVGIHMICSIALLFRIASNSFTIRGKLMN